MDDAGYRELRDGEVTKTHVQPGLFREHASLPVGRRFVFAPHVDIGSDRACVELIGPVDGPGGDGPSNGMYALQKSLRKRIDDGLDWLSIKSLPASRDARPWFWNWADRRCAAWWDSEGLPFVQGPNMLFVNSGTPRFDAGESWSVQQAADQGFSEGLSAGELQTRTGIQLVRFRVQRLVVRVFPALP